MKNLSIVCMLFMGASFIISCEGDDGIDGIDGIDGRPQCTAAKRQRTLIVTMNFVPANVMAGLIRILGRKGGSSTANAYTWIRK